MRILVVLMLLVFIVLVPNVEAFEEQGQTNDRAYFYSNDEVREIIKKLWGITFVEGVEFYNNSFTSKAEPTLQQANINASVYLPAYLALDGFCHQIYLSFTYDGYREGENSPGRVLEKSDRYARIAPDENCDQAQQWIRVEQPFPSPPFGKYLIEIFDHMQSYQHAGDWCNSDYIAKTVSQAMCVSFFAAMEGNAAKKIKVIYYEAEESVQHTNYVYQYLFSVSNPNYSVKIMLDNDDTLKIMEIDSYHLNIDIVPREQ